VLNGVDTPFQIATNGGKLIAAFCRPACLCQSDLYDRKGMVSIQKPLSQRFISTPFYGWHEHRQLPP
jgi:hypothetical protein